MPDVALTINGTRYAVFKAMALTRGVEFAAAGVRLDVADAWASDATRWPIREGDECAVMLDGETILTGTLDSRSVSLGADQHSVTLTGRDRSADMVDSSLLLDSYEFYDQGVAELAPLFAEQFGVAVTVETATAPRSRFAVNPGETGFEALARLCRLSGVLPIPDGLGGITITRTGSARASVQLVEGENVLAVSGQFNEQQRFRRYVVLGQRPGTDMDFGLGVAAARGEATDAGARAGRTLVVISEGLTDDGRAQARAEWEATVRAAQAAVVTVSVQGWRQGGSGDLWPINALVSLRSPTLGVNEELLIAQTVFTLDETGGTRTELTLKRPDAYTPEPEVPDDSTRWEEIA